MLHVAASGETKGYYADYKGDTEKLGRALAEGFAFQGELMPYRGRPRGAPSAELPPTAFVAFIQNHDQVGNRAFGDRVTDFAPAEAVRAIAAVYLLLPQIPMLFMGEEWGAAQPFPFFCDFGPELADAVRKGRREEFARFPEFQDPAMRERIPDPMAEETFASAKLDWDEHRAGPAFRLVGLVSPGAGNTARRDRAAPDRDPGRRDSTRCSATARSSCAGRSAEARRWYWPPTCQPCRHRVFRPNPAACSGRRARPAMTALLGLGRSAGLSRRLCGTSLPAPPWTS